jgi:hypothetical protein
LPPAATAAPASMQTDIHPPPMIIWN